MVVSDRDACSGQPRPLQLDLKRDENAPGVARAAVTGLYDQPGMTVARYQTLLLLVSEIVTNAVLHSKAPPWTPIRFSAGADRDRVRVQVHDGGPTFDPPVGPGERGGWGLHILDREARDWGVQQGDGTLVWFELALGPCGAPPGGAC